MYGKQKSSNPAKDFDINDIDDLLNSTMKDVDEDLDMNDPELLKQLQEISSSTATAKPKKKPVPVRKAPLPTQNMEIDIDSYAALAQGDEDIEVELDERDFQDPHLLNELSSLSNAVSQEPVAPLGPEAKELMNMGFTQKQALKALDMFDNNLERAANYLFDSPPVDEEEEVEADEAQQPQALPPPHPPRKSSVNQAMMTEQQDDTQDGVEEQEEESIDPEFWKAKAQEYQKLALQAKRDGDKKRAVALLRESKNFTQKHQDLLEIHGASNELMDTDQPPAKSSPEPAPSRELQQQQRTPPSEPAKPATSPPPPPQQEQEQPASQRAAATTNNLQQVQDLLGKVISLQKQYKEAAIYYKGLGNLAAAKHMVRTSKELLHTGIRLKNGEIVELDTVRLPEEPDMSLGDGKIRQVEPILRGPNVTSFDQIEAQLRYQMNVCHNLSIQHALSAARGKAINKTLANSQQQDAYARTEEAISADLVSLHATKPNIPPLHYEQVDYTYKNLLDTIPDNMMEFKIIKAISLPTLDISTNLEPFVTWDFGGWPPENTAQAAMNKGETSVVSGINPEFDFTLQIPISRTNRLFQRYVQRKKLTIEVFHNKYTYGLFRRPVSLGKVVIPMDRLLTKSSIAGAFDLLDGSRKKTGGKIDIQVNLREPLTGEDIAKRSERWLVLDAFGSTVSECLSLAHLTVGGPQHPPSSSPQIRQADPVTPNTPAEEIPVTTTQLEASVEKQQPTQAEQSAASDNSELEAAEEEFNSVDNIVSNMVMEHELNLVNSNLASKSGKQQKDDMQDRKQALEIKMNMLVIQVQTGILDMDTYLENVQKRMDADRRLAIVFKKHNRLDLAKAALVRKKIMQDELDEARAAMAEGNDE
ncbi:uncharacterized protein ATC70_008451 [Mucor velutinosus]|uniref:C2 domain-containing protein n=1 Tax=Mucor velutinosus TaxID=708070 RepID=A0AAN7DPA9_9FUNG|nr:hypothetical protein ATC70_008451 [Mucor velutinosus]